MATGASLQRQEAEALFEAKHGELLAEARGVALEFGVDVRAVAFRPGGGGAVHHEFVGATRDARVVRRIRRAVARDVSAMGMEEVAEHERQLGIMRAVVARALQAKAAAGGAKRAPKQQQEAAAGAGAGDSKIRMIIID
ncbi:hypothetical protein SEVIR_6G072700v4 [Setaria viridis]|uniref:MADS-box domain-containing protein n=1 Tax=Setaria viridis TaxID=4556 RepID=A0A4U6U4Q0_SETVI|nr:hypothetical protein SEVIR_6G072700v2 [Setaria viridis]